MADPIRIRDVPHGVAYQRNESATGDLSGVSTIELRECAFRSKNAGYRAETSLIGSPAWLYREVYIKCVRELKKRNER